MANNYSTITTQQLLDAINAIITTNQQAILTARANDTLSAADLIDTIQNAQGQITDAQNQLTRLQKFVDATFFPAG